MAQAKPQGEYYFRKTEMVAGLNFTDDKFQFFFSYGAVDRSAMGSFTIEGNLVKLKSDKEPGKDFTITGQSKQSKGFDLVFKNPNEYLLKNILCTFIVDGKQREEITGNDGRIHVDLDHCDTIFVQHILFPDVPTIVKDINNVNNSFTLELNPSLEKVSFKGIDFQIIDEETLGCLPNYILPMTDIKFTKQ